MLPALLAVLGHRVNALAVRKSVRAGAAAKSETEGGWYRLARAVMRRPIAIAGVIVDRVARPRHAVPAHFLGRLPTHASLSASSTARQVEQALENDFPANSTNPIEAVVTGVTEPGRS